MFEQIKITEYIYEGVVAPYINPTKRENSNHDVIIKKHRGEYYSYSNNPNNVCSYDIRITRNYDTPVRKFMDKHFMIHVATHPSEECILLTYFCRKRPGLRTSEYQKIGNENNTQELNSILYQATEAVSTKI